MDKIHHFYSILRHIQYSLYHGAAFFNGNKMMIWTQSWSKCCFFFYFSSLNKRGKLSLGHFWSKTFWPEDSMLLMLPDSLGPICARWRRSRDSAAYLSSVALNVIFVLPLCSFIWQISMKNGFDQKCKRTAISSSSYSSRRSDLGEKGKSVVIRSKEKGIGKL